MWNLKVSKFIDTENQLVVARGSGCSLGKMGEGGQEVQTSIYKISHGDIMYRMLTIVNNTVLHTGKLFRQYIFKSSSQEKQFL